MAQANTRLIITMAFAVCVFSKIDERIITFHKYFDIEITAV